MEITVYSGKDPEILDFTITNNPNIEIICKNGAISANISTINDSKVYKSGKHTLDSDTYSITIEKIGPNPNPNNPPSIILKY
jgi:hypothetical protein